MSTRRRWSTEGPALFALAWSLWILGRAHVFFMRPPLLLHPQDEGYVNAFALRMNEGQMLPFVDAVSHRGPMLYWVAAIAVRFANPTSWMPMRMCAAIVAFVTTVAMFAAARRARHSFAGGVAAVALVVAFLLSMGPGDGAGYSGEQLLDAFVMAGLWALVAGLDRYRPAPSRLLVGVAGALAALGALSKQVGVVTIVPLGLWVLAAAISRAGLTRRRRWELVLAFASGVALPVVLVLLRYAAAGEVRALYYWTVVYNMDVYMAPYTPALRQAAGRSWILDRAILLGIAGPLVLWGATRPLASAPRWRDIARAYDEHGFVTTVALGTAVTAVVSNATLRDFAHYYVQVVPWAALLLGLVIESAFASKLSPARRRPVLVRVLVLLPLLLLLSFGWTWRAREYSVHRARHGWWPATERSAICAYVKEHSAPGDKLFVWGFYPELYTACDRRPASRFVYTTLVAGLVPWFAEATKEDDDRRAAPGSRALLIADLEASKPPVLIDAATTLAKRPMRRYDELARYLEEHYCPDGTKGDLALYLRKDPSRACPPPPPEEPARKKPR